MSEQIFTFIEKDQLVSMLKAFHTATGLTTYLMSAKGDILLQFGATYAYCNRIISHISETNCNNIRIRAGQYAMQTGETYIFSCHANLNHISFPLIHNETLLGTVQVGPFLMNEPDSYLMLDIGERYKEFSMRDLMLLYDEASEIPQVAPGKVSQLSQLLYYLMSSLITDSKDRFIINRKKMVQQAKINESIQMYKTAESIPDQAYPMHAEHLLLTRLKEGNRSGAAEALNELLAFYHMMYGGNLSLIRNRVIELAALMSHTALERGAYPRTVFALSDQLMQNASIAMTIDELTYSLEELLESLADCTMPLGSDNNKIAQRTMDYVLKNFAYPCTLQDAAKELGLNASYLSRVFRQSTGQTFKEYVTYVRMEEAKRLLLNTDYPILDIAISVGFDNAAYFAQVFRKHTGLTPLQYRK